MEVDLPGVAETTTTVTIMTAGFARFNRPAPGQIQIGVICGSLLPFLVSFRHWSGFKATCLRGEKSAWDSPTHHFEVDGPLRRPPPSPLHQRIHKRVGVKDLDVVDLLADADVFDGDAHLLADGNDDAAFGRAVEFGQDDSCATHGF